MPEHPLVGAIRSQAGWLIGLGILTVILGVLAMGCPFVTGLSVAIVVGSLLLVSGVGQCIFAFQAGSFGSGLLAFVLGALTVVCGVMMISDPMFGLGIITIVLVAYLIVEGIFEIFVAFQVRPMSGWGWMAFSGVISVVLGALIWSKWPLSGAMAIGILLGIKLLFLGTWMLMLGFAARSAARSVTAMGE